MREEDEMRLPYLVFRTWRNYEDKLLKAYESVQVEDYQLGRKQLHQARKSLLESKELLLRRGMDPDDDWISEVNAMLLDNLELVHSLISGDHEYVYQFIGILLDVIEIYKDRAVKEL